MLSKILLISLLILSSQKDLFEDYYAEADKIMAKMTLEERIGQMFFPRYNDSARDFDIKQTRPGGFVLFGVDFDDTEENIIKKVDYIQKLSQDVMHLPLGLAVDEEGGTVNRVSRYHRDPKFPSPQEIYDESGIEGILEIDQEKRDLLRKFKMNINLAPVADISYNESDYMFDRTLGRSPNETAEYIRQDVESYVADKFTCCCKHFPGYGNNINTHTGIAIDERPYEQFVEEDFQTFIAGIEVDLPMILVSHNIVKCKDEQYPASISKNWHDILRGDLGYSGLILTDDLTMDAIRMYSGDISPAVIAVNAGNDILLTSTYYEHRQAVIDSAKNGTISEETINKACRRVLAWKVKYLGAKYTEEKEDDKPDKPDEPKDKPNDNTLLIVAIAGGVIVLAILFLIIIRKKLCRSKEITSDNLQGIGGDTPLIE